MKQHRLEGARVPISCLGLGTVKFGRNEQVKYPVGFDLPSDEAVCELLDLAAELGINLLDTAPAYGASEERLGRLLGSRRDHWAIVTKAGEDFVEGTSRFDFSGPAIRRSVERSLTRLRTDRVEGVLLHSDGNDLEILRRTDAVATLESLKAEGKTRSIGISTKTVEGGKEAIERGLDTVMVTYNPWHRDEEAVLDFAAERGGCSVLIKKAFGSGWFGRTEAPRGNPVEEAFRFIFHHPASTAVISGTIDPRHLRQNAAAIDAVFRE